MITVAVLIVPICAFLIGFAIGIIRGGRWIDE